MKLGICILLMLGLIAASIVWIVSSARNGRIEERLANFSSHCEKIEHRACGPYPSDIDRLYELGQMDDALVACTGGGVTLDELEDAAVRKDAIAYNRMLSRAFGRPCGGAAP